MIDTLFALGALAGVIAVALSGYRFIRRDDDLLKSAVLVDFPAVWGATSTDEVMSR